MFRELLHGGDGQLPSFIQSVEDFPHLKIVRLCGNLDASTIPEFHRYLRKAEKSGFVLNKSVILDFKGVGRLDSAGVAELLNLFVSLKAKKHRLGLMNVPDCLRSMIEVLQLCGVFMIFESDKSAFEKIREWADEW